MQVNSQVVGYAGTSHPNVGCLLFGGLEAQGIQPVIQVRGFSSALPTNTALEVDIPNVAFCLKETMDCLLQVSTSYTQATSTPYTLNTLTSNLGQVIVHTLSTSANGLSAAPQNLQLCATTTWTFSLNLPESLAIGDTILIKLPTAKMETRRTGATSSLDSAVDIVVDTDYAYYIIELQSALSASPTASFTLSGIRNPQSISP